MDGVRVTPCKPKCIGSVNKYVLLGLAFPKVVHFLCILLLERCPKVQKRRHNFWNHRNIFNMKILSNTLRRQIEVVTCTTDGNLVIAFGGGSVMIWSHWDLNLEPDDIFSIGR